MIDIEKLKEILNSKTKEELEAEYEAITHEKFNKRWAEKIHNLSPEKRLELIHKVKDKYTSDEYIRSEYRRGYEPRTPLYFMLYEYAARYGEVYEDEMYERMFPTELYIIDNYIIRVMYGQGTVVDVFTKDEWEAHKEYLKKCK